MTPFQTQKQSELMKIEFIYEKVCSTLLQQYIFVSTSEPCEYVLELIIYHHKTFSARNSVVNNSDNLSKFYNKY